MEFYKIYNVLDVLFYISTFLPFDILIKMRRISKKFKNVTESVLWQIHNLDWTLLQSECVMVCDKSLLIRNNKKNIFNFALDHGYDNIIHVLLKLGIDISNISDILVKIFKTGNTKSIFRLLDDKRVDPSACNNFAIRRASVNGHIAVVQLLLNDKRVDPSAYSNFAIQLASANGHTAVVQLLLNDKRVDPSACDNYAIRWASANGHIAVIQLLLKDSRVDPTACDNSAIGLASADGHTAVVQLLLNDPRVDQSLNNNK
jgi:ankyrin repeat protein